MNLIERLKKENVFIADSFEDTDGFYSGYAQFLQQRGMINDRQAIKRLFMKRESLQSTAIGKGAAAPHIFSEEFSEFVFSIALIREGLDFKAPDEKDVFLVFFIMSDKRDAGLHLKSLAHIARLVKSTDVVEEAQRAGDAEQVYNILKEKETLI